MERLVDKMRADFVVVASSRIQSGSWSPEDEQMAGAAIKAALDAKDEGLLLCWARWLAGLAARDLSEAVSFTVPVATPRACSSCQHRARPGLSAGYCSGREDLARAYGHNHPLRVLPPDGGVSCNRWNPGA